jgi:hypothetical protein
MLIKHFDGLGVGLVYDVSLVEETGVARENHRPAVNH